MSRPFSVSVHAQESDHCTIKKNGFISCTVSFNAPRSQTLRMGFCLHCKELLTYTGSLKHCKRLAEKHQVRLSQLFCPEKVDFDTQQFYLMSNTSGKSGQEMSGAFPWTVHHISKAAIVWESGPQRTLALDLTRLTLKTSLSLPVYHVEVILRTNSSSGTLSSNKNGTVSKIVC